MKLNFLPLLLMGLALVTGCGDKQTSSDTNPVNGPSVPDNPLLQPWTGPFDGVPAFDAMELKYLKQALELAMEKNLGEIDVITGSEETPSFDNTIVELEGTGRDLSRVLVYYRIWRSNVSSPEFRDVQAEIAPKLSAFRSKIRQNPDLVARVQAVYENPGRKLTPHERRLLELTYNGFVRNGGMLTGAAKDRYSAINQELAGLHARFANNVLADEENYVLYLDQDQLSGLPETYIAAASAAAKERGKEGSYAVTNTRSSMAPFLTFSDERELREQVWRTYYNRGDNGDEYDNNAIIVEILKLRQERVALLGYENYASWRLENRMAQTPARAFALLNAVWPAAVARVREEVADMQTVADAEGSNITIEPWDYRYYAEKVRKAKFDLDSDEVKAYLQLENLRDGMFYVAGRLFNFEFRQISDGSVPVYHQDVTVWEVTDRDTKAHVGLWYFDPFARRGKRSGAWASAYRSHETYAGKKTVLSSNNSNFVKGAPGEPNLVSWSDAQTMFHEMGHALHALSSQVAYPSLNWGVRDYTEFQSQLLERWLFTDEMINNYMLHYQTGEPMPATLVQKIKNAATFNQGFATTEYLASALVDMAYHTTNPDDLDPDVFETETLQELGMPKEIVMRHRSPHFGHIFSGEGYSAGYYGYLWADVLTADAAEAFAEAPGGFYDKPLADKLVEYLFAPRNAIEPAEAYRLFRGRDAAIGPLMRDRGFPEP